MKRSNPTRSSALVLLLTALFAFGLIACQTDDTPEPPPSETGSEFDDAAATAPPVERAPAPEPTPVAATVSNIDNVYFDFDRSDIRPDAAVTLKGAASGLSGSGQAVVIAGHTDNRGSEEYNLALGERRAASVRRYLANLGVPMQQMTIVSYGEIRPAANGNTESAWALNRRAEFSVAQ